MGELGVRRGGGTEMLADPLPYQQAAVRKALDQANLRTRIPYSPPVTMRRMRSTIWLASSSVIS